MKIIDVNCGVGTPLRSNRYKESDGLIKWLDEYRIDSALAYHSVFHPDPVRGNRMMMEQAAASNGRVKLVLGVNTSVPYLGIPGEGSVLDRLRAAKPVALRAFPTEQMYPFNAFYAAEILEVAQQMHLPVIVDGEYTDQFLSDLPQMCRQYPDVPFILLRHGDRRTHTIFPILKQLNNVYFEIGTMCDNTEIEQIVTRFGSEHLLFGSGLPMFEPSGPLGMVHYALISQEDKENIAYKNFERLEGDIRYGD